MKAKKRLLKESLLYVIIDKKVTPDSKTALKIVKKLKDSTAGIIQLRDKKSKKGDILKEALRMRGALLNSTKLFIVNDYADVAKISGADGVHVGQNDLSLKKARRILGKDKIIGVSCATLKEALRAQKEGADYVGMGPVFFTATKRINRKKLLGPAQLGQTVKKLNIPVFAIGGITPDNISRLLSVGINRVSVCTAVCCAKNIRLAKENLHNQLVFNLR